MKPVIGNAGILAVKLDEINTSSWERDVFQYVEQINQCIPILHCNNLRRRPIHDLFGISQTYVHKRTQLTKTAGKLSHYEKTRMGVWIRLRPNGPECPQQVDSAHFI